MLHINKDIVRHTYALLAETQPFTRWNMPPTEDVIFHMDRHPGRYGCHWIDRKHRHHISVSSRCSGTLGTLIRVVAHEMVHLYEDRTFKTRNDVTHSAVFKKLAREVCKYHSFDPVEFC